MCPEGCHETAGRAPFCADGRSAGPCRVRDPAAGPEYRCDTGAVCIRAVGEPAEQFKGRGRYEDATCDGQCGDGRKGEYVHWTLPTRSSSSRMTHALLVRVFASSPRLTPWIVQGGRCTSDKDCSLAGVCTSEGKCDCDPWAEGADCSYLRFAPVDRSRLGYLDERHSSWGGSVVRKRSDGSYSMYTSEIVCEDPDRRRRCGLDNWETHSRIVQATASDVDGPYRRVGSEPVVLHPEHHNPSLVVSPVTGDWHLFTISGPAGPIERVISNDEGATWGAPRTLTPRQNPGPVLKEDGSVQLFYRADGLDLPSPTCSTEGIAVTRCPADDDAAPCDPPDDVPVFGHTGEDPHVFVDHRGRYHMLFNALPYRCRPKFEQGGHAWSADGVRWEPRPRIGAFDSTIRFTDGSSVQCERRERPQMVVGEDGRPIALVSGVTGCPKALGDDSAEVPGRFYRGADDSFTLVQKVGVGA